MIKIMYIASTLANTGPTNQLFNLIKYLDPSLFDIHLVTLSPEPRDSRWADYEKLDIKLYSLNLSRLQGIFKAKQRLEAIVSSVSPDILHSQGLRADILISGFDIKKVCTVHNFPQYDYSMSYGKLKGTLMAAYHMNSASKHDCCIGVSDAVSQNLIDSYQIKNTKAIKNGVDTELFHTVEPAEKIDLRNKLNIPVDGRIWISSGHLSNRKDPLFLINFWKQKMMNSNDYLIFIGDGDLRLECENTANGISNILFKGKVNNVKEYLCLSDFYLSASKAEGLPMAVIEAMACGLPLVLSNIEPHNEVLKQNPLVGESFVINSYDSLETAVNKIIAHDPTEMSKASQDLLDTVLGAKVMAESYAELYQQVLRS